jgi:hypothetical protein
MAVWLLLALFFGSVVAAPGMVPRVQTACPATPQDELSTPVPSGATPVASNGRFQLPACKTIVIDSIVNNGPLPPPYQAGREIAIDTTGMVTITTKTQSTPEPTEQIANMGVDGLQRLLGQLKAIGYFDLPQTSSFDPSQIPIGGPNNILVVTLADGTWNTRADVLTDEQKRILNEAQQAVSDALMPSYAG